MQQSNDPLPEYNNPSDHADEMNNSRDVGTRVIRTGHSTEGPYDDEELRDAAFHFMRERERQREQRGTFLQVIFGGQHLSQDAWAHLWKPDSTTAWVQSVDAALAALEGYDDDDNLYLGVALAADRGHPKARITNSSATGLLALPVDIDIQSVVHDKPKLPPDLDSAYRLLDAVGLTPSLVVATGHGLQGWFLLDAPWLWAKQDTAARVKAQRLLATWDAHLQHTAAQQGWELDTLKDLARLLRLPGSVNAKSLKDGTDAPRLPVTLARVTDARYTVDDVAAFLRLDLTAEEALKPKPEPETQQQTNTHAHTNAPDAKNAVLTTRDLALLSTILQSAQGAVFHALWTGHPVTGDKSQDDAKLVERLAFWLNRDVPRMDRWFRASARMRAKWDEKHFADGTAYGTRYGEHLLNKAVAEWVHEGEGYMGEEMGHDSQDPAGDLQDDERNEKYERTHTFAGDGQGFSSFNSFLSYSSYATYPEPPNPAAFYGLAGDYVRAIAPHTESDPVGLLAQFLTAFGAMAGRHAYFTAEADKHYPNLFVTLVGDTSRSRKGSGLGIIKSRFREIDANWFLDHIQTGLSSGEGIVHALRNTPPEAPERASEPLLSDKRLLIIQSEFASVLKMFTREGNTLSTNLRDAWDGMPLQTLTKNSPERATDYHLAVVGHVTQEELIRNLTETESANGFGNRFAWFCVRRSQLLPEGGNIAAVNFTALDTRLDAALRFASEDRLLTRDTAARALWRAEYPRLSEGRPGLLGALTARAEAYVMRLALIYALLDCSPMITELHLRAALALWDYVERSVRAIFGDALGDPIADTILSGLRAVYPQGLTRTEISNNLFGRNAKAEKISLALMRLLKARLARVAQEKSAAAGRPAELWYAVLQADRMAGDV